MSCSRRGSYGITGRGRLHIIGPLSSVFPRTHFIYSFHLKLQLWQAFVGVRARRVEKYYHNLLAPETNVDSKNTELEDKNHNLESVGIPEKWKVQIEKVIYSSLPMK